MKINNSAYNGVEALARLAARGVYEPCKAQCIADWINRSLSYTESLMAKLRDAGLVVSRLGPGGGYSLARPADRIMIAEVFQTFDAPSSLTSYPSDAKPSKAEEAHDLHGADLLWEALRSYVLSFLSDVSLADVVSGASGVIDRHTSSIDEDDSVDAFGMRPTMRH